MKTANFGRSNAEELPERRSERGGQRVRLLYLRVENLVPFDARYFFVGGYGAVVTVPMRCILALPEKGRQHLAAFAVGKGQGPVEQHATSFPAGSPSARRLHL